MIPIRSLFEAHLTVSNLERSMKFYGETLGLELAQVFDDRRVAFYWLGGRGHSMLGIWETGSSPQRMSLHVAFTVDTKDLLGSSRAPEVSGNRAARFHRQSNRRTSRPRLDARSLPLLPGSRRSLARIPGNASRDTRNQTAEWSSGVNGNRNSVDGSLVLHS